MAQGVRHISDEARAEANRESARRWRAKNPGWATDWARRNPEKRKAMLERHKAKMAVAEKPPLDAPKQCVACLQTKQLRDFTPHKLTKDGRQAQCRDCMRAANRLKEFGISGAQFETIWVSQNGGCAICTKPLEHTKLGCAVDHDHSTGRVRGLLCQGCNLAIGHLKDNADLCENAAAYLRRSNV